VIPDWALELTRVKEWLAVPPVVDVVPPVTVIVSPAVLPTDVVIELLEREADGGSLIRIVTFSVADTLFESVAVKV
jgi:hypothetical protein